MCRPCGELIVSHDIMLTLCLGLGICAFLGKFPRKVPFPKETCGFQGEPINPEVMMTFIIKNPEHPF